MTTPTRDTGPFTVRFGHLGRGRPEPLVIEHADGPAELKAQIRAYARRHLVTQGIEVQFDPETMTGSVVAGWRNVGPFTVDDGVL